ncbi:MULTISPECIES: DUF2231 domain-containing protein [unclassified Sporolactobacillus]|uniref:DUF2231 domain-containing protein n=1 Tax=unclassified Sporolactobacillus TaxID=2628533 RepID=UPI0023688360|nr:DUF2231 domain-containing protein [Sporolactobacillus sp. CQH2019]MDD9146986.1 hypothetical protein [Sporolactobacillus sp. CQH2019]
MFGSPLHPLLVHFPIALLLLATVTQIIAVIWKKDFFDKAALYLLVVGFLSGIVASLSGDGAEQFASTHWGNGYLSVVRIHKIYAAVTMLLFAAALGARILLHFIKSRIFMPLVLAFCILGSITLALTGHYGGQMVYIQKHSAPAVSSISVD